MSVTRYTILSIDNIHTERYRKKYSVIYVHTSIMSPLHLEFKNITKTALLVTDSCYYHKLVGTIQKHLQRGPPNVGPPLPFPCQP